MVNHYDPLSLVVETLRRAAGSSTLIRRKEMAGAVQQL